MRSLLNPQVIRDRASVGHLLVVIGDAGVSALVADVAEPLRVGRPRAVRALVRLSATNDPVYSDHALPRAILDTVCIATPKSSAMLCSLSPVDRRARIMSTCALVNLDR